MASQPIVIGLAQYRQWKRHCLNAQLGRAFLDKPLTATWPKRGHNIFTRGRVVDLLGSSRNTDERLNFVVVRRQILVSNWPIFAKSVLQTLWLEVERPKAPGLAAPQQGAPANGTQ